uniref:glutathione transferase n=1 Tax=Sinohyriopsis cumingii TaxID=165450 RepID=A0A023I760_SINCU|nr:sigma class glutathione S-transferase [Sinohyriopsis cumingii]
MRTYRLTYSDIRGRAELARLVFVAAGESFEDRRVSREEWAELKKETPFGQIPVLEVDGKPLAQSYAIARFLGREFGLAGSSNWESAQIDQVMDLVEDLRRELLKVIFEKEPDKKKDLEQKLQDEVFPKFIVFFQKLLENTGGQYFVGSSLSLADLAVLDLFDTPLQMYPSLLDKSPALQAHRKLLESSPKLDEYLKSRKKTDI